MTDLEHRACKALNPSHVRYPPGSVVKAIGRDLWLAACDLKRPITDKQAAMLWRQVHRFRRQLAALNVAADVLAEAERMHKEAKP